MLRNGCWRHARWHGSLADRQPDTPRKKRGESREVRRGGLSGRGGQETRSQSQNASPSTGSQSKNAMKKRGQEFKGRSQVYRICDWPERRVDLEGRHDRCLACDHYLFPVPPRSRAPRRLPIPLSSLPPPAQYSQLDFHIIQQPIHLLPTPIYHHASQESRRCRCCDQGEEGCRRRSRSCLLQR